MIVWSIPALVIVFLGGIAWIGSHDLDPPRADRSPPRPRSRSRSSRSIGNGCSSTPTQGIASVNRLVVPVGRAGSLPPHLGQRHEQLLHAAARQPDLHHARHDDPAESAGRPGRHVQGPLGAVQRRRLLRHALRRGRRCRRRSSQSWVESAKAQGGDARCGGLRRAGAAERGGRARDLRSGRRRASSMPSRPVGRTPASRRIRSTDMLGKLTWAAIPFDQPIIMGTVAVIVVVGRRGPRPRHRQGLVALSVARVDHQRRSQAHRRHVLPSGAGDAGARLLRRHHDAHAAGPRGRRRARAICRPSTTIRSSRRTARS